MSSLAKERSKPKKESKKPKATPKKGAPKKATSQERQLASIRRAALLLKQASDPTRLQMLVVLNKGDKHVGAICALVGGSQPVVSHHLSLLKSGRLVEGTRNGKQRIYALTNLGRVLTNAALAVGA